MNPYDPCVANKNINGKYCAIVWHLDNSKISHESEAVVKSIVAELEEHFGKMLSVRHRLEHDFFGNEVEV